MPVCLEVLEEVVLVELDVLHADEVELPFLYTIFV
jgi:hypothetical protein